MTSTEELEDRLRIRILVEHYAQGADDRDGERFASVFTDDAVLHTGRREIRGREAIRDVPASLARYRVTMHLVTNHDVTFTADADADAAGGSATHDDRPEQATGATYCVARHVYARDAIERVYVMHLRYDDRFERTADGWRIAQRQLVLLWDEDHPLRD